MLPEERAELIAYAHARDTGLQAVELAIAARSQAERDLEAAVLLARAGDHSWAAIGDVFGISRQAAFKRFGDLVPTRD